MVVPHLGSTPIQECKSIVSIDTHAAMVRTGEEENITVAAFERRLKRFDGVCRDETWVVDPFYHVTA